MRLIWRRAGKRDGGLLRDFSPYKRSVTDTSGTVVKRRLGVYPFSTFAKAQCVFNENLVEQCRMDT